LPLRAPCLPALFVSLAPSAVLVQVVEDGAETPAPGGSTDLDDEALAAEGENA
jgi:hypothetical protein